MKKKLFSIIIGVGVGAALIGFSSCSGEKSTEPVITFITSSALISKDTALVHGTVFNIGVKATKSGTEGLITDCTIARSVNSGADSTIQKMNLVTQGFTQIFSYTAPDSGSMERYTFAVTKQDGLKNSVSVSITGI